MAKGAPPPQRQAAPRASAWKACAARLRPVRACASRAPCRPRGTCSQAAAGTEITGSCADGQACDASGSCKAKNGTVCSSASLCASGFCVDGVCCESACAGRCLSCIRPVSRASVLPTLWAAIPKRNVAWAAACAARPATARAPAIIRNTEASAAPVSFVMAQACASTPILPSAASAALAEAVKVAARVELEEWWDGRRWRQHHRRCGVDPSSAEWAA